MIVETTISVREIMEGRSTGREAEVGAKVKKRSDDLYLNLGLNLILPDRRVIFPASH